MSAQTTKLFVWVHDHKTLGKDKEVAEAEVEECFLSLYISLCFLYVCLPLDMASCQAGWGLTD